jgi:hypothetical protein
LVFARSFFIRNTINLNFKIDIWEELFDEYESDYRRDPAGLHHVGGLQGIG